MTRAARVVAVAAMLAVAGCSFPFGDDAPEDGTPTATPTVPDETPAANTPTPDLDPYPPGVDEGGIENVTALLVAHDRELNRTGFVATGAGNTTILRSGFLINVSRNGRTVVAAGGTRYVEFRRTEAGPLDRLVQRFANGSVELRRRTEDGNVEYGRGELQGSDRLANVHFLESLLAGGDFRVVAVHEEDGPVMTVLRADETANESAVLDALPAAAESVRAFDATVRVDGIGRVHYLEATVGFVVGGDNRTHDVTFNVTRIGVSNVTEPDWVDDARDNLSRVDGHWSRSVVSTSGCRA